MMNIQAATVNVGYPRSGRLLTEYAVGQLGGLLSSTVVPEVHINIPSGALTEQMNIGVEVQVIDPELMFETLGELTAVSPVVIVEPRGHTFHRPVTITFPRPFAADRSRAHLHVFCSIVDGGWENISSSTPLNLFDNDERVSISTTTSGRYWLVDSNRLEGTKENLAVLYRKAFDVEEETDQVHLVDENMEPTVELGAIGGVVPEITNPTTEAMATTSKKRCRSNPNGESKHGRKLARLHLQLGYVPPSDLAPAPDKPGLLGASPSASAQSGLLGTSPSASSAPLPFMMTTAPSLQQGAVAYVIPAPCIIMSLPQGPSAGRGTSGTSSQTRPSSYKKL